MFVCVDGDVWICKPTGSNQVMSLTDIVWQAFLLLFHITDTLFVYIGQRDFLGKKSRQVSFGR